MTLVEAVNFFLKKAIFSILQFLINLQATILRAKRTKLLQFELVEKDFQVQIGRK